MAASREIDYKKEILNPLTQEALKDSRNVNITIQILLYEAATRGLPEDEGSSISNKMSLFALASKVANKKHLKPTELIRLRDRASKFLSVLPFALLNIEVCEVLGEEIEEIQEPPKVEGKT